MIDRSTKISISIFLGSIITFSVLYGPQGILNEIANKFHLSATAAGFAMSISTIFMSLSLLFVPAISNVYGRKSLMICSLLLSSILNLCLPFSPNFEVFLVIRALQGILVSGFPAIAVTYISEEMPVPHFNKAVALYVSGTGAGGFLGRISVSFFTDTFSWQIAIGLLGILNIALSILFILIIPDSMNFNRITLSVKTWANSLYEVSSNKFLWLLYIVGFISMGTFVTLFNYIGFILLNAPFSLSQTLIGLLFIFQFAGAIGSNLAGVLINRYSKITLLIYSACISIIGALFTLSNSLYILMIGLFLFSIGFFATHSIASGWVSTEMTGDKKPYASSMYLIYYYVGASIIGIVGGLTFDTYQWEGLINMLIMCFMFIFVIASILHIKTKTKEAHTQRGLQ